MSERMHILRQNLRNQASAGGHVTVAKSYLDDTVRLVYRKQPGGAISDWQVESGTFPPPMHFQTREDAEAYIRHRWGIAP